MEPNNAYLACVVPLFEAGKLAGLGRDAVGSGGQPAWNAQTQSLDLPVYYHWRFRTGSADFETLARRLVPRMAGDQAGLHDLDLGRSGGGLNVENMVDGAQGDRRVLVSFAGGLTGPETSPRQWSSKHKEPYQRGLAKLLSDKAKVNTASTSGYSALDDDPVIGPPAYGRWQAKPATLSSAQQTWQEKTQFAKGWMHMANGDPALRAAAGLGARIVARHQEEFVARAWTQLAGAKDVKKVLRNSRTAMAASRPIHAKISALSVPLALQMTQGVHDLVSTSAKGEADLAEQTRKIDAADVLTTGFARFGVAATAKARRIGAQQPQSSPQEPTGLASSSITIAMAGKLETSQAGLLSAVAGTRSQEKGAWTNAATSQEGQIATIKDRAETLHSMTKAAAKPKQAPDPDELKSDTVAQLDPAVTLPELMADRVRGLPEHAAQPGKIVKDFSFPLAFDEPTYRKLQQLDPDFLMPGFSMIPEDTVTIVEANAQFIEAFLIGMNHELSREFAWRQMPLLLNGSWFRRFWDYRGATPQFDIEPIDEWKATRPLGGGSDRLEKAVLLVKSELFQQYPRTSVYAVKAKWGQPDKGDQLADATRPSGGEKKARIPLLEDPAAWHRPIFDGTIGKTAKFFGFDLSAEDLVGEGNSPGYFLMFEQGVRDTQFGLDPANGFGRKKPSKADNLHWGHFAADQAALAGMSHAPAAAPWGEQPIEGAVWGANSANTARLSLQRLVRILFPAGALIDASALKED